MSSERGAGCLGKVDRVQDTEMLVGGLDPASRDRGGQNWSCVNLKETEGKRGTRLRSSNVTGEVTKTELHNPTGESTASVRLRV